ncbi:DoxX family protein [uncultured Corynebacterium sp.]|uniref:DoxX family protein n=1 Tax=uncultured Corynebacterium sp. TaxID=159447 RepID=UPI0025DD690F|nr:DoxX family protein [uncultured Corynebacterium sp.]
MSDNTKNPNPRNLGDYEEGLDDDFDVPTYRRIADDHPADDVAPDMGTAVPVSRPTETGDVDSSDNSATEIFERPDDLDGAAGAAPHGVQDGTGAGPLAGSATGASAAASAAVSEPDEPAGNDDALTREVPRRDIYAAAGRAAPQKIEPLAKTDSYREADADFAATDHAGDRVTDYRDDSHQATQATEVTPAPGHDSGPGTVGTVGAVGAAGGAGAGAMAMSSAGSDRDRDLYDDSRADDRTAVVGTAADDDFREDAAAYREDDDYRDDPDPRRGTLDLGLLLLRLGVGGMLLMLGLATFFQFGGAPGIGTLEAQFADNGYNYAGIIAVAIPTVQVIAGGLLVLGLATPLGAALALAISAFLTMFEVALGTDGWNILAEGAEPVRLHLMLTAAALALQFTGPGRYGIDFSRGWARRPLASSWIFCILAIVAAVALWYLAAGQVPFVDSTTV